MPELNKLLSKIKEETVRVFSDNLVGIYVHGSIAFDCFNWDKSDVDYIVVINKPISLEEKVEYIRAVSELNRSAPSKGIEMSIVLEEHCRNFVHPVPFELHFSNFHLKRIENDIVEYCHSMNGVDPDLAAHFTVINKVGQTLWGKEISEVFAPVPKADYLDSIKSDVESAADDIFENPVYIILNLCRVLAYIKDDLILSKQQGGEWGVKFLPEQYKTLVFDANLSYTTNMPFYIDKHRDVMTGFAEYMTELIFTDKL